MIRESHIPVYKQLAGLYKEGIERQVYPPGTRIDSIVEIMDHHRVSRDTAKMVLKSLTEEGLVVSKTGKGSFVRRRVHLKKEWTMIVPFFSPNMETLLTCLNSEALKRGRRLEYYLDYNSPEQEMKMVGSMIAQGMEAILLVPSFNEALTADFYRKLSTGKTKLVLVDHTMAGSWFNYVVQSYDLGVKRALDHLVSSNAGNVLFVKNQGWQGVNLLYELMEQTLRAMVGENYPERSLFVLEGMKDLNPGFLRKNKIGGILASLDTDSVRIAGRLVKWGIRLPSEVSLVSYGNTELLEFFHPAITAVDCLYKELAAKTAALIDNWPGNANPEQHVIQPVLVIRET